MSDSLGLHGLQHPRLPCPSLTPRSLLKLMSIKSVIQSNYMILCPPLLLPPSIFTSIRVFYNESVLPIRWPKYWSFNFSISPSNDYSAVISKKYYDSTTWFIKLVIVSPKGTSLRTCHRAWKLVLSMRLWVLGLLKASKRPEEASIESCHKGQTPNPISKCI